MGARDLENKTVEIARRDNLTKEVRSLENIEDYIEELLVTVQNDIYKKAETYRNEHITKVDSYEEKKKSVRRKGGFIAAHWDGTAEEEEQIKEETKATIRCIPRCRRRARNFFDYRKTFYQRVLLQKALLRFQGED